MYDYDRVDAQGDKRELHLERAKEVTTVPHQPVVADQKKKVRDGLISKQLIEAQYFTVYHWTLHGKVSKELTKDFLQVSVIHGSVEIRVNGKAFHVEKGTHFILPHGIKEYELQGKAEFVVSFV